MISSIDAVGKPCPSLCINKTRCDYGNDTTAAATET